MAKFRRLISPAPPSDGGRESVASGGPHSTSDAIKPVFDPDLKQSAWLLAAEFPNTSALPNGLYDGRLNKGMITILKLEAIMRRCGSPASTHSIINHVSGLIQFFLDSRGERNVTPTGESPLSFYATISKLFPTVEGRFPWRLELRSALGLGHMAYIGPSITHYCVPHRMSNLTKLRSMRRQRNSRQPRR